MLLSMLKAKLHSATVTETDLHYEGSIGIDSDLLERSGILPFEQVDIWNVNNGARLSTYVIEAPSGSGEISLNGAAARHVERGDKLIIAAFAQVDHELARNYRPTVLILDDDNRVKAEK